MRKLFYLSFGTIGAVLILQHTKFMLAPLAMAILFAITISPLIRFLESKKWNTYLAIFSTTILLFAVLLLIFSLITKQYYSMINDLPNLGQKLNDVSQIVLERFTDSFGIDKKKMLEEMSNFNEKLNQALANVIGSVWNSVSGLISFLFILPVFTILILFNRKKLNAFVKNLPANEDDESWEDTLIKLKKVIRSYIIGVLLVIILLAILNTVGLLIFGIPFALALGLSSAVLTVIPYLGNLFGGGLAMLVAFATKDNPKIALGVMLMYVVIQFLEGNLITPKIAGNQVGINALTVILSLLFSGFVWGVLGMIIAVPCAAALKVILNHYRSTQNIGLLMGD